MFSETDSRLGYDDEQGIYFDRTKTTDEVGEDGEHLFEECEPEEVCADLERLLGAAQTGLNEATDRIDAEVAEARAIIATTERARDTAQFELTVALASYDQAKVKSAALEAHLKDEIDKSGTLRKRLHQAIKHIDDMTAALIAGKPTPTRPEGTKRGLADTPPEDDITADSDGFLPAAPGGPDRHEVAEAARIAIERVRDRISKALPGDPEFPNDTHEQRRTDDSPCDEPSDPGECLCGAEGPDPTPYQLMKIQRDFFEKTVRRSMTDEEEAQLRRKYLELSEAEATMAMVSRDIADAVLDNAVEVSRTSMDDMPGAAGETMNAVDAELAATVDASESACTEVWLAPPGPCDMRKGKNPDHGFKLGAPVAAGVSANQPYCPSCTKGYTRGPRPDSDTDPHTAYLTPEEAEMAPLRNQKRMTGS